MNFSDIVKLYDKNHGIVGVDTDYSDTKNSHYSDMQKKLKKVISDEEFIEFTEINPQKVLNNEDIIK